MKLKNLLFGTMIACAFVSCSNDDEPTPNPTTEGDGGVAELIVNPDLLQGNITKASTKAAISSTVLSNYFVYVFDRATGANLGFGRPNENIKVANNPGAVDVMVIANVGATLTNVKTGLSGKETKSQVLDLTRTFDNDNENGVFGEESGERIHTGTNSQYAGAIEATSQSSHLYPFTLQSGLVNKVGYTEEEVGDGEVLLTSNKIQMYRHVAKIALNKISVDNKPIDDYTTVYGNPQLEVKSAFILNAQYETKLANAQRWGSVFKEGIVMGSVGLDQFNEWIVEAKGLAGELPDGKKPYIPVEQTKEADEYVEHQNYGSDLSGSAIVTTANPIDFSQSEEKKGVFYVYESTKITNPTLLVVEADFTYDNPIEGGTPARITETGYYTVQLGVGALSMGTLDNSLFPGAAANMGVRRNIQYNVNMIVRAPGSKNPLIPDTKVAGLGTMVELVDYGQVSSTTEFE